jgi:hypothetical protein
MHFNLKHALIVLFALAGICAVADAQQMGGATGGGWTKQDVNSDDMKVEMYFVLYLRLSEMGQQSRCQV